jgi:hypothetical protein
MKTEDSSFTKVHTGLNHDFKGNLNVWVSQTFEGKIEVS